MRALFIGLAAALLPGSVFAADWRGPMYEPAPIESRYHSWSGTYIGGQGGFTQQRLRTNDGLLSDPLGLNADLVIPFGKGSGNTASYGGFIGFNAQWEDIVLGFEFNYNRLDKGTTSSRTFGTTYTFDPAVGPVPAIANGTATQRITDLFGGRFRAGYSTGIFLPYATVGVVVARGEAERFGSVTEIGGPNFVAGSLTSTSATPFGFSVGGGVDVAITSNLFARAEIEYVGLRESKGIRGQMTTYRAGLGYRF